MYQNKQEKGEKTYQVATYLLNRNILQNSFSFSRVLYGNWGNDSTSKAAGSTDEVV